MEKKNIFILTGVVCAAVLLFMCFGEKEQPSEVDTNVNKKAGVEKTLKKESAKPKENVKAERTNNEDKSQVTTVSAQINKDYELSNAKMYDDVPNSVLPLSAITELALLPQNIQDSVAKITDTNSVYMAQKINDKLFLVIDNQENIRHGVDFVEISLKNGHQTKSTLGYNGKIQDSENDKWEYDSETNQPTRHMKYDKNGDLEFTEVWNYDSAEPIKYEMKDAEGRVISLRKEVQQDDTNLRIEHLIYDKNGNTKVTLSTTYEGSDLKRFTYYNADKPKESASVFSEFSDGQKTSETVFTSDLKVKNVYKVDYKDGVKESITVFDSNNNEVGKFTR